MGKIKVNKKFKKIAHYALGGPLGAFYVHVADPMRKKNWRSIKKRIGLNFNSAGSITDQYASYNPSRRLSEMM